MTHAPDETPSSGQLIPRSTDQTDSTDTNGMYFENGQGQRGFAKRTTGVTAHVWNARGYGVAQRGEHSLVKQSWWFIGAGIYLYDERQLIPLRAGRPVQGKWLGPGP